MRVYKKVTYSLERLEVETIHCDWCAKNITKEIEQATAFDGWSTGIREFRLEFVKGHSHRDGGLQAGWEVTDLCDDCVGKLRELLTQAGIAVSPTEIDW